MKLLIDNTDIDKIKKIYKSYPVDGVTSSSTILAQTRRPPFEVLKEIRKFIGADAELHVQAVARTVEGMIEDAHRIQSELGKDTYVKIPAIETGFEVMKILKAECANVTATAIYTPMQAFLAAKAGASYAAPYINRIDNMGYDGVSDAITSAVDAFINDFEKLVGKGKTMKDC